MPQQIETNVGTVEVRVDGPADAPPVVLSHPALTNHDLWNGLTAALSPDHRVIRATLPLGAHRIPAVRDRINPENLADALVEVLDALGVERAAFVGGDSGGALIQLVIARHPERVDGAFFFSCDAFDNFPPKSFRPLCALLRTSPRTYGFFELYRLGLVRKWAGWRLLAKRGWTPGLTASCFDPMRDDRSIRDDTGALFASVRPASLLAVTDQLTAYAGPVHIAWSRKDLLFPAKDAERLAATFPNAELSWFEDSLAFAFLDEPDEAAARVRRFLAERVALSG